MMKLLSDIEILEDFISVYGEDVTLSELLESFKEKEEL